MDDYMFVAHKPTNVKYFRGHYEGYHEGGYVLENHCSRERVVHLLAHYALKNQRLEYGEDGYAISVFKGGFSLIVNGNASWDGHSRWGYDDEAYPEDIAGLEAAAMAEGAQLLKEVVEPIERKKKEELVAAEAERRRAAVAAEASRLAERRRQFEIMKAEFESSPKTPEP